MYEPLEVTKCEKCGKVIAEPKELIRNTDRVVVKAFKGNSFIITRKKKESET